MTIPIRILRTTDRSFPKKFSELLRRGSETPKGIERKVRAILDDVRRRGNRALLFYTKQFDGWTPRGLEVTPREIQRAYRQVAPTTLQSLKLAAKRIKRFHRLQGKRLFHTWSVQENGVRVGEAIRPIERVGIYVPGGLAAYPSTVLMNAIPARVAGVREILMVSPWSGGAANPTTLVAAHIAGVRRIFKVGGAQAIGALAFGTETIPPVDKIVGPGNIYVATAKRLAFGQVGIDMIAGPTEIVIVADETADPAQLASDLLSQAEHDALAVSILLTSSRRIALGAGHELQRQIDSLPRRALLKRAVTGQGTIIVTRDTSEAIHIANQIAPEHLSLQIRKARKALTLVHNAGAIFLGPTSPVAFGDYLAGPNHVLPTSRTARFSSPLGVVDFLKRSSVTEVSSRAIKKLGPHVIRLAKLEGLTAHAASVEMRLKTRI